MITKYGITCNGRMTLAFPEPFATVGEAYEALTTIEQRERAKGFESALNIVDQLVVWKCDTTHRTSFTDVYMIEPMEYPTPSEERFDLDAAVW